MLKFRNKNIISIILPVYNEGDNIESVITSIIKIVKYQNEILVIYDFDQDNTIPPVKKLQIKYKNIMLVKNNLGKGVINAAKSGIQEAKGQTIVIMPADLADDPNTINKMQQQIDSGFDIICATRYSKGGKKFGGEIIKTLLSRCAGLMTPIFLGIPTTDLTNGFKMYRTDVIKNITITSTGGWEFAMEVVIKAHNKGFKISEVPSVWKNRVRGKSKFKLMRWLPLYIKLYFWGMKQRFIKLI